MEASDSAETQSSIAQKSPRNPHLQKHETAPQFINDYSTPTSLPPHPASQPPNNIKSNKSKQSRLVSSRLISPNPSPSNSPGKP